MSTQLVGPVVFLVLILALLATPLQESLQRMFERRPRLVFLAPLFVCGLFCAFAGRLGALTLPLVLSLAGYTLLPALCVYLKGGGGGASWLDLAVILFLWLPLEFNAGKQWVPEHLWGAAHMLAYGAAVLLALILFLLFRRVPGIKYELPRRGSDFLYALAGFAVAAPVLILVGRAVGFIPPFHVPAGLAAPRFAAQFGVILLATALPEELLFRGLIQNCLMQRLGEGNATLLLAALIFGAAHLDNGPGPLPNWRYMIVATIAGFIYGKVFQKASSVFASAGVHAMVNAVKHSFF